MPDPLKGASTRLTRSGIIFVTVCGYLGITAVSINDMELLIGQSVAVSGVNISVPVFPFYLVAPVALILLHLNFLLAQLFIRTTRMSLSSEGYDASEPSLFRAFLPLRAPGRYRGEGRFPRIVLSFVFLVINIVLPLGLLFVLQAQVLPRHWAFVRWWYPALTLVDVGLLFHLVPAIRTPSRSQGWWHYRACKTSALLDISGRIIHWAKRLLFLATLGVAIATSWLLHDPSGIACENQFVPGFGWLGHLGLPAWPRHHLDLSRGHFSFPPRVRLVGQDLRCADFEGLDLHGLDFSYSDLTGANFARTDLQFARFGVGTPSPATESGVYRRGTLAIRASFRSADVRGSDFDGVDLTGATFQRALGNEATFRRAELAYASFTSASFIGSVFDEAHLEAASLDDLTMLCASARGARFDLASLRRARLAGVDFLGSSADGADFELADLRHSSGLGLSFQNLRGALLGGACPAPPADVLARSRNTRLWITDVPIAQSSDFRFADLKAGDGDPWRMVAAEVSRAVYEIERLDIPHLSKIEPMSSQISGLCRGIAGIDDRGGRASRADAAERRESELSTPDLWSGDGTTSCFSPAPFPQNGKTNLVTADEAKQFRDLLGWDGITASSFEDITSVQDRWVAYFTSRCDNPRWMKALLARFFLLPHPGFEAIEDAMPEALERRKEAGCRALDVALEEWCKNDPESWNQAVDRTLGSRPSSLRCDG